MKVVSYERQTGKGAQHGVQVLTDDGWTFLGDLSHPGFPRTGRDRGFDIYRTDVDLPHRVYHRTNSGAVTTHPYGEMCPLGMCSDGNGGPGPQAKAATLDRPRTRAEGGQ